MIRRLIQFVRPTPPACTSSNCSMPICPRCLECVRFCVCP